MNTQPVLNSNPLRIGMVGFGMIFDETYRPLLETLHREGLYRHDFGLLQIELAAAATRTGKRAEAYKSTAGNRIADFANEFGDSAVDKLLKHDVDVVFVATPDDRHFEPARTALQHGKHVLIEKPSVLSLDQLDELQKIADENDVLAKVVYHKLADPDHKKMRTLVQDGVLKHVNTGYCTLLEPKLISSSQFAEWIQGRNPGTYVAVHYIKLIDYSFGPNWQLKRISANGQRGMVGSADSNTWDSVQLQITYEHPDGREAAFDIHTSWVTPDNFPGYVEQEVQFRFDNAVWNAHQRKRGVEVTVENQTPTGMKTNVNNHYNGSFLEPWGERSQRGYGIEILERFLKEVGYVEFAGARTERKQRLVEMRALQYNDLSADRNCVAIVQAMEAILRKHSEGVPGCLVEVNCSEGGLVLRVPGGREPIILYSENV